MTQTQSKFTWFTTFDTELGWMAAAGSAAGLARLVIGHSSAADALSALELPGSIREHDPLGLAARLQRYAAGEPDGLLDIPLDLPEAAEFTAEVREQCRAIPYGQTRSYAELAAAAGSPRAARAVGNVMRTNLVPLIVPCHRVLAAGNRLGGYSAPQGLLLKKRLLAMEAATMREASACAVG